MLDLHVHSTYSDGTFAPEDLVARAAALRLTALAVADHDCVDGTAPALAAGEEAGLLVIPAVELSCSHATADIHVLGYFVDHRDAGLTARLESLREARRDRAGAIVRALAAQGFDLSLGDVLELSARGSVGRTHVARALLHRGHVGTVAEAFERFLGRGKPFYVPKPDATPEAAIAAILDAGGVPVLAHPGVSGVDHLIPHLVDAGLRGLEAYHGEHSAQERARYRDLADRMGLLVTGGSDYHGPGFPNPELGRADVPDSVLAPLLEAAGR